MENKNLKRRIVEISYKYKLSHLGSCLTAVDIIKEIYDQKKESEPFILSAGHSGLALYVVLEACGGRNAEEAFLHHGVHPDRCRECHIDCSAGSLGHGLPIAVGMAIADRERNVWCLISDGECAEGSIWEALRIADELELTNLNTYVNANSWGAYKEIPEWKITKLLRQYDLPITFVSTTVEQLPLLKGQDAHYHVMTEEEYKEALELLL